MSLAAPEGREKRARAAVLVAAWAGLVTAVCAGYLGLVGSPTRSERAGAFGFLTLALTTAMSCLGHGRRHEHERGRAVAIVTILVALAALGPMLLSLRDSL